MSRSSHVIGVRVHDGALRLHIQSATEYVILDMSVDEARDLAAILKVTADEAESDRG